MPPPKPRLADTTIKSATKGESRSAGTKRRWGSLVVIQGSEADVGSHVLLTRPVVMGREDVELSLHDSNTSRRHAEVVPVDDPKAGRSYLLRDLDSTNGTKLNGKKVTGSQKLKAGDKIFIGSTVIRFEFADELDVRYQAELERALSFDPLTGLLAQRQFDAAFAAAVSSAERSSAPLSVLVMDIDNLKPINDAHGHAMGGFAISEIGRLMARVISDAGLVTRFGGDEFMAFLPGLARKDALALAERIRVEVATHRFEQERVVIAPTLSIGVASFPEEGSSAKQLFASADRALYRAKAAGKNRIA
jgi:two-component system, cell cycle response regulator